MSRNWILFYKSCEWFFDNWTMSSFIQNPAKYPPTLRTVELIMKCQNGKKMVYDHYVENKADGSAQDLLDIHGLVSFAAFYLLPTVLKICYLIVPKLGASSSHLIPW